MPLFQHFTYVHQYSMQSWDNTIVVMHPLGPNTDLPTLNKLQGCSPIFYESSPCKNNQMENLLVLSSLIFETRAEILNKFHFLVHLKTQKFSFKINRPLA